MLLPSRSAKTAHQLVGVTASLGTVTVPPSCSTFASVSSMESTSMIERGWVKPSVRGVSAPPETPLGACQVG